MENGFDRLQAAVFLYALISTQTVCSSSWSEWWTYEGISGPEFWGLVNPEWSMCTKGKRQSPINIEPENILYDPSLKPLKLDKHLLSGTLANTGHDISVFVEHSSTNYVNISGGPLSYQYRVAQIAVHFGSQNDTGSEHAINGSRFPAEIQILGYNAELHGNLSQALVSSNGVAVVSLFVKTGLHQSPNVEFDRIAQHLPNIRYKGQTVDLRHLSISSMLPHTDDFITYEGSLTQPGCQETVTWILFNKPIYITLRHLSMMREVMQGDENHPKFPIRNNCRPVMSLNQRPVRTNIPLSAQMKDCAVHKRVFYKANISRS